MALTFKYGKEGQGRYHLTPKKKKKKPITKRPALKAVVLTPFGQPKYVKGMKSEFYKTREWQEVRWRVLRDSDRCCKMCGRSKAQHGVILHIDHIKPRSKFPELELHVGNLQVLCEDCNLGKGATVWRD